jgi:hypothetical protein
MCFPEQPEVEVRRTRAKAGPLRYPSLRVVSQLNLPKLRVGPLAVVNLRLDESQKALGVRLALEGLRAVAALAIQSEIADLITGRRQPPDVPEAPVTCPVAFRHHATPLRLFQTLTEVIGATRPAATNSANADSLILT